MKPLHSYDNSTATAAGFLLLPGHIRSAFVALLCAGLASGCVDSKYELGQQQVEFIQVAKVDPPSHEDEDGAARFRAINCGYITTLTWHLDTSPADSRQLKITKKDYARNQTEVLVEFPPPPEQTSYQDRDTRPDVRYDYVLQLCQGSSCEDLGKVRILGRKFNDFEPPKVIQPANPWINSSEYTLEWEQSECGYSYDLYQTSLNSGKDKDYIKIANRLFSTSFPVQGLESGARYAFRLQSCGPNTCSRDYSNEVAIGIRTHPLETPVINAITIDGTTIRLAWSDVHLAANYQVWRAINPSGDVPSEDDFIRAGTVTNEYYSDSQSSPSSDMPVHYRVQACNDKYGCSEFSAPVSGVLQTADPEAHALQLHSLAQFMLAEERIVLAPYGYNSYNWQEVERPYFSTHSSNTPTAGTSRRHIAKGASNLLILSADNNKLIEVSACLNDCDTTSHAYITEAIGTDREPLSNNKLPYRNLRQDTHALHLELPRPPSDSAQLVGLITNHKTKASRAYIFAANSSSISFTKLNPITSYGIRLLACSQRESSGIQSCQAWAQLKAKTTRLLQIDQDYHLNWRDHKRMTLDLRLAAMPASQAHIEWQLACTSPRNACEQLTQQTIRGQTALRHSRQLVHIDLPETPPPDSLYRLRLRICTADGCTATIDRVENPQPPNAVFGLVPSVASWGHELKIPISHLPRKLQAGQLLLHFSWLDSNNLVLDQQQLRVTHLLDHALVVPRPTLPAAGNSNRVRLSLQNNDDGSYLIRDSMRLLGTACSACSDGHPNFARLQLVRDTSFDTAYLTAKEVCTTQGTTSSCTAVNGTTNGHISGFSKLVSGHSITCGVLHDKWWCWGQNKGGIMPEVAVGARFEARPFPYPARELFLANDYAAICTIEEAAGHLYCWGETSNGALLGSLQTDRNATTAPRTQVVNNKHQALTAVTQLAFIGNSGVCALAGTLFCWGKNYGQHQDVTQMLTGAKILLPAGNLPQLIASRGSSLYYWQSNLFAAPAQKLEAGLTPTQIAVFSIDGRTGAWLHEKNKPAVSLGLDWFNSTIQTASQPLHGVRNLYASQQRWCFSSNAGELYCSQ